MNLRRAFKLSIYAVLALLYLVLPTFSAPIPDMPKEEADKWKATCKARLLDNLLCSLPEFDTDTIACCVFSVEKNGEIEDVERLTMHCSSGSLAIDKAILQAVKNSSPFDPCGVRESVVIAAIANKKLDVNFVIPKEKPLNYDVTKTWLTDWLRRNSTRIKLEGTRKASTGFGRVDRIYEIGGEFVCYFRMKNFGELTDFEVLKSSGDKETDNTLLALCKKVSPLPQPPLHFWPHCARPFATRPTSSVDFVLGREYDGGLVARFSGKDVDLSMQNLDEARKMIADGKNSKSLESLDLPRSP